MLRTFTSWDDAYFPQTLPQALSPTVFRRHDEKPATTPMLPPAAAARRPPPPSPCRFQSLQIGPAGAHPPPPSGQPCHRRQQEKKKSIFSLKMCLIACSSSNLLSFIAIFHNPINFFTISTWSFTQVSQLYDTSVPQHICAPQAVKISTKKLSLIPEA